MDSLRDAKKSLDAFISYRRSDGSHLASLLKTHLEYKDFKAFLDVRNLKDGRFDKNLEQSIKESKNFVLVLTPKALGQCIGDIHCEDWVHKEIVVALNSECKIIPVFDSEFKWPNADDLPEDMRAICLYNGLRWDHENQKAVIDKLVQFMKGEEPELDAIPNLGVEGERYAAGIFVFNKYLKSLCKDLIETNLK